ncbi:hypothetical protein PAPYR_2808 [Paratrimastix pyriformis]|uniref:Uncharacterized protein n=1 Tax=Paratrimastix pyriformis TaxID=342808 RepID=A0ABQ8UP52_9EUKA|nr:hypothetical protein PAPYR_2808 [Paratrimastix pyriformis]
MAANTVLVLGSATADNIVVSSLIAKLVDAPAAAGEIVPWQTETKYYRATIGLRSHSFLDIPDIEEVQALIFVFDVHQPASYEAITAHFSALSERFAPDTLLAVGLHSAARQQAAAPTPAAPAAAAAQPRRSKGGDLSCFADDTPATAATGPQQHVATPEERNRWFLEQQVEYVELDLDAAPSAGDAEPSQPCSILSDGLTGIARVREALHCCSWPAMERKQTGRTGFATRAASGGPGAFVLPPPESLSTPATDYHPPAPAAPAPAPATTTTVPTPAPAPAADNTTPVPAATTTPAPATTTTVPTPAPATSTPTPTDAGEQPGPEKQPAQGTLERAMDELDAQMSRWSAMPAKDLAAEVERLSERHQFAAMTAILIDKLLQVEPGEHDPDEDA